MNNFREELMKVLQANLGESFEVSETETVKIMKQSWGVLQSRRRIAILHLFFIWKGTMTIM